MAVTNVNTKHVQTVFLKILLILSIKVFHMIAMNVIIKQICSAVSFQCHIISTHVQEPAKMLQFMIYCSRQRLVELLCTYLYLVVQIRHKGYPKRLMSYPRGICLGHVLKYLFLSSHLYNKHRRIVVEYAVLIRTNSCLSGRL